MPFPGQVETVENAAPREEAVHRPKLAILSLYPELLNVYGDRGNLLSLLRRARWHGIDVVVTEAGLGTDVDATRFDLAVLGGGQDRAQRAIAEDLRRYKGPSLAAAIEAGLPVLAVCAAYQLLGHFYRTADGYEIPGLGIFDVWTEAGKGRLIGNIAIRAQLADRTLTLVGFENHGGRTYLGPRARPLGRVLRGHGNNGVDRTEGVIYRSAIGTYLHGSLLPKNPELADWLLQAALDRRYGGSVRLGRLDDRFEERARTVILRRLLGPPFLRLL